MADTVKDYKDFIPFYGAYNLLSDKERMDKIRDQLHMNDTSLGDPLSAYFYVLVFGTAQTAYAIGLEAIIKNL